MQWNEIEIGDTVKVYKGTRTGPVTFDVQEIRAAVFQRDSTTIIGTTRDRLQSWVYFTKTNGYRAFLVKDKDKEFEDDE